MQAAVSEVPFLSVVLRFSLRQAVQLTSCDHAWNRIGAIQVSVDSLSMREKVEDRRITVCQLCGDVNAVRPSGVDLREDGSPGSLLPDERLEDRSLDHPQVA